MLPFQIGMTPDDYQMLLAEQGSLSLELESMSSLMQVTWYFLATSFASTSDKVINTKCEPCLLIGERFFAAFHGGGDHFP